MTIAHPSPPEPGRVPTYPWAEWLNGREWTLTRGRDYWDENKIMARRIRGAANNLRIPVVIDDSDSRFLRVKAMPRGD
jgi:hypothetical protein